jgi:ATP-dependent helicase HrpA
MIGDKVAALLKSLPQKHRRHLLPLDARAAAFVGRAGEEPGARGLVDALIEDLREHDGVRVAATDFRLETLPAHLFVNFRVVDEHGRFLAVSRNLAQLRAQLGASAQGSFQAALRAAGVGAGSATPGAGAQPRAGARPRADATPRADEPLRAAAPPRAAAGAGAGVPPRPEAGPGAGAASPGSPGAPGPTDATATAIRRAGERFQDWSFGPLPELLELAGVGPRGDETLIGYPALVDRGDAVALQVFDEPEQARREHRAGLRRLFAIALREPLKWLEKNLPDAQRLGILYMPFGTVEDLRRELVGAVLDRACLGEPLPAERAAFEARVAEARPRLALIGQELARTIGAVLAEHATLQKKLAGAKGFPQAAADVAQQLAGLLPKDFVSATDPARLTHLVRYLRAASARLDKLRADPERDAHRLAEIAPMIQNLARARAALKGRRDPRLEEFRWLLEELRVSLFAQELRTPMPVSVKRLHKVWESIG